MRAINMLVVHCSASDNPKDDSPERIKLLHTGNKKTAIKWGKYDTYCKGWSDTGYHFIITQDGVVHNGRPTKRPGAHVKGYNKTSIGICLTGENNFTEAQFKSLKKLVNELMSKYELDIMDVLEHNKLNKKKTCPNFDLQSVLRRYYAQDNL